MDMEKEKLRYYKSKQGWKEYNRINTEIDKNRDIGKLEKLLGNINPDYRLERKRMVINFQS